MNDVLQSALEGTDSARSAGADFAVWEIRAVEGISDAGERRFSVDGGARVELPAEHQGLTSDRFAVGAGPRAASAMARGGADLDATGWDRALAGMEKRVDRLGVSRRLPAVRAALGTLGATGSWRFEYLVRVRAWSGSGGRRGSEIESSVRVRADIGGHRLDTAAADDDQLVEALARTPAPDGAGAPAEGPLAGPEEGPVVLLPAAAGRWAHELAHAVLEGCPAGSGSGASDLRDDPSRACWPFGYRWDDDGWPAAPLTPGALRGHLRRASVRDRARPLPSCSWIEPARWIEAPEGALVAGAARSGRLDPASGTVLLELEDLARVRAGQTTPIAGSAVAVIDLDRVLTRGAQGPLSRLGNFEPAQCARQGSLFEVMVGAPTLVLDNLWMTP